MPRVTLLLGSNLGDRAANLSAARQGIERVAGAIVEASPEMRTEPWGYASDNYYLNQVVVVDSLLDDPLELLDRLLAVETALGRVRSAAASLPEGQRYEDRTIDIDILYIDDLQINHSRLIVPHPRIAERDFVQQLLAQLA